jgi:hypothetical protein
MVQRRQGRQRLKKGLRTSALIGGCFLVATLLASVIAGAGWGSAAQATETSVAGGRRAQINAVSGCGNAHSSYYPDGLAHVGLSVVAGPIIVGCGKRLGEPVRFIAYVQADARGREQLCYVLEQPHQKIVTGGDCFQTAPSFELCTERCPLSVFLAHIGGTKARQASKGSLVTGAAPGVMEEVVLLTSPLGKKRVTPPFIVILEGAIQEELRLPSVVSLFASVVVPCLPAGQAVYARGHSSGEEFAMQGSDPFGCRA